MRKMLILASAFAVLGAGVAGAQDFKVSEPNSGPGASTAGVILPGSGAGAGGKTYAGYNAADSFAASSQNNAPADLHRSANVDRHVATASTGTVRTYKGHNAADDFGASY